MTFFYKIDYYQLKECHLKGTIIGHIPNETVKVCKNKVEKVLQKKWKSNWRVLKRWPDATKKWLIKCCKSWMKKCCKSYWKGAAKVAEKVLQKLLKRCCKSCWKGVVADWKRRLKKGWHSLKKWSDWSVKLCQTGSTGPRHQFNRFQPRGFLVNTSRTEVQLRSSAGLPSWARKFSWSDQLSLEWKF